MRQVNDDEDDDDERGQERDGKTDDSSVVWWREAPQPQQPKLHQFHPLRLLSSAVNTDHDTGAAVVKLINNVAIFYWLLAECVVAAKVNARFLLLNL